MAHQHSHALRVPPDSTGKRMRVTHFLEIPFTGMASSGVNVVEVGDHIQVARGATTVLHGFCISIVNEGGTGILGIIAHTAYQSPVTGVQAGDLINRQEAGVYYNRATAAGPDVPYYVNAMQLVSHDNPLYGQKVDQYGAGFVRFTEGGVTFDGSGRMRQTNNITIAANEFHDLLPYHYTTYSDNGGTVTHDSTRNCVVLSTTGTGVSEAGIISDKTLYHESNAATYTDATIRIGDAGKTNVVREWGLQSWNHDEGIVFRLNGTALSAVLKNKTSGATVETVVPAADWSYDSVGFGAFSPSQFKLDLTKTNSYWIEIVQDGAGAVKMGVFNEDNVRILCHIFQGNNRYTDGFLSRGSFPFHFHQDDNGGGSASQMFIYANSAELEGPSAKIAGTFYEGCSDPQPVNSILNWIPLFSVRPKLFIDQRKATVTASTNGSANITISAVTAQNTSNATTLSTGMQVSGVGVAQSTYISSISGSDITLTKPLVADMDGAEIYFGSIVNHQVVLPKLISVDVVTDSDRSTPVRIKLEVFRDATLTGAVWAKTKGNTQTDYVATLGNGLGATAMTGGTAIAEWIVRGNKDLNIGELFDYANTYLVNKADGSANHTLTIAAKVLDPGVTANIVCALTWEEVESR